MAAISQRSSRRTILQTMVSATVTAGSIGMCASTGAWARDYLSVSTGAASLSAADFSSLTGMRVGLITNQTGRVGDQHLVDLLRKAPNVRLTAILAPEHGFRGQVEAGAIVDTGRDASGVSIYSLYGADKAPTGDMLREVDVLVFDIQDIGARFYTYISTMGLAMQAAARARIPFVVLDRPNPLGGQYVSGFVLEDAVRSFVGMYPIPIVHGMTIGELARMIKGERWLENIENLELNVIRCEGLRRSMRWPETKLPWIATSPNIPTFLAALSYPGVGIIGETQVNEGHGTPLPFSQFGAPWLDAHGLVTDLGRAKLPGVRYEVTQYTPRPTAGASLPRFTGEPISAVRLQVTDVTEYTPLELGIYALALLCGQTRGNGAPLLATDRPMFHAIAGTRRLHRLLRAGATGADIVGSWDAEVAQFRERRKEYLLY